MFNQAAFNQTAYNRPREGFTTGIVRVYIQDTVLSCFSELRVLGKIATRFTLRFLGLVSPGDVVEIDAERMTATINNQNALHLVDGRFREFITGRNTIRYTDSEITRQVALTITFRDRWL